MSIKPIDGAGAWRPFRDQAVPVPSSGIGDSPRVSLCFNADWLVPITTALKAMMRPEFWAGDTQDAINSACVDAASLQLEDACMTDIQFRSPTACTLEFSSDGGETWTQIYDSNACILQDLKDGIIAPGAKQPTDTGGNPGDCHSFGMVVPASGAVAVPVLVSEGDTVQLSNIDIGPWIDSFTTLAAYCSDGHAWSFPAGCGSTELAHENDPLQTANHMALIAHIGEDYYDVSGGDLITVPSGVTDATIALQPNDDILWDNLYSIYALVTVCKPGWTHVFDFEASDNGWGVASPGGTAAGHWVSGLGWAYSDFQDPSNNYYRGIELESPTVDSRDWTKIEVLYSVHGLSTGSGGGNARTYLIEPGSGATIRNFADGTEGDGLTDTINTGWTGATKLRINYDSSYYVGSATFLGSVYIHKITISGNGTDPF